MSLPAREPEGLGPETAAELLRDAGGAEELGALATELDLGSCVALNI